MDPTIPAQTSSSDFIFVLTLPGEGDRHFTEEESDKNYLSCRWWQE